MTSENRDATWRRRLDGVVPPQVDQRRVLIAGCGSVGSFLASELARSGVRRFTLIDPDLVEWPNLTRTVFGHRDVGMPKVDALSEHLRGIFGDIEIDTQQATLQDLGGSLGGMIEAADLVVAAMDDPAATGRLNRHAYLLGRPAVFVGLYKGAKGGEVVMVQPEQSPCFHCSTGGVREVTEDLGGEQVNRGRDYGTNRLVAEVALGCDIHLVCTAAVKVALSILSAGDPDAPLAQFVASALEKGSNYLILGMTPDYFVFPSTHREALGQHAFQSLWLTTARRAECIICGDLVHREPLS